MTATEKDVINAMSKIDVDRIDDAYKERNDKADDMLGELMDEQDQMNSWEYDFVDSLVERRSEPDIKSVTFNQYETILKLHTKYCDGTE